MLLTLVVPGKEKHREEAIDLLSNPEAFWNVLVVNSPMQMAPGSSPDPTGFLTPLAQFVRGICSAIISQRQRTDPIFEELKKQLAESAVSLTDPVNFYERLSENYTKAQSPLRPSGNAHLFDDQSFSNSKLYHWIIKICYEICGSIEVTLKFVRNLESNQLAKLQRRAHNFEKSGLQYWTDRMKEETESLDTVHAEVQAFKEQVKEMVCSLAQLPLFFTFIEPNKKLFYILQYFY